MKTNTRFNLRHELTGKLPVKITSNLFILIMFVNSNLFAANNEQVNLISGTINPSGIFVNTIGGGFSATELFQIMPISGVNRYQMINIAGGGFDATINTNGEITLEGGYGNGFFLDQNNFNVDLVLGGTDYTFSGLRVPFTTESFPLLLDSARPTDDMFADTWENVFEAIDITSGSINFTEHEQITLQTSGNVLAITDSNGDVYTGVFENGRKVVFRKLDPDPKRPDIQSFPGSDINYNQDLLASVYFNNINSFTGVFLLQTRDPIGSQVQSMFKYTATRTIPLDFGDVDGNGTVNILDRDLIVALQGKTVESNEYKLSADLNLNNIIDNNDLIFFDSGDEIFKSGFEQ